MSCCYGLTGAERIDKTRKEERRNQVGSETIERVDLGLKTLLNYLRKDKRRLVLRITCNLS